MVEGSSFYSLWPMHLLNPVIPLSILNHTEEPVTVYACMRLATMHSVKPHMLVVEAVGGGEPEEVVGTKKQKMWNIVEQSGSPGERDILTYCCPMQTGPLQISEERTDFVTTSTLERQLPSRSLYAVCPSPRSP